MSEYVAVAKVSDLEPGQKKRFTVGKTRVLLANADGTFYALRDHCGHQRAALSKGKLEDHVIECPLHFARFDVRTGKMLSGPDFERLQMPGMDFSVPGAAEFMQHMGEILSDVETEDVPTYEVRIKGDTVEIRL